MIASGSAGILRARGSLLTLFAAAFGFWAACGPQATDTPLDPTTLVAGDVDENPDPGTHSGDGGSGGDSGSDSDDDGGDSGGVSMDPPELQVSPGLLDFGLSLEEQSFVVRNAGGGVLVYSISTTVDWAEPLTLSGSSAGETDSVAVRVHRDGLLPGVHEGQVRVATASQTASLNLRLYVSDGTTLPALLEVQPATLDFGSSLSIKYLALRVVNAGESEFSVVSPAPWLTLVPASGVNSGEWDSIEVRLNRAALPPGISSTTINVSTTAGFTAQVGVFAESVSQPPPPAYTFTGRVVSHNQGLPGVTIVASDGAGSTVTDASGNYSLSLPSGWYGTLTPINTTYSFGPPNRVYAGVGANLTGQDFAATPAAEKPPGLAIVYADGTSRIYTGQVYHNDDRVTANIQQVGQQQWRLSVFTKNVAVKEVWFPWDASPYALNANLQDDVMFSALFAGVAQLPLLLENFAWRGHKYPGTGFAPLTVIADPHRARIVAATNWPVLTVTPMYSLQRQSLCFPDALGAYQSRSYTALVAEVEGIASAGLEPWQLAADKYSAWLRATLAANDGEHNPAPWFRETNGWLNFGLMNQHVFTATGMRNFWQIHRDYFPWIQVWGQMSNYAGDPNIAVPPLEPDEEVGCCLIKRPLHTRYVPELVAQIDWIRAQGGAVGLYTRPRAFDDGEFTGPWDDPAVVDGETNLQWFLSWIEQHKNQNHVNAFYLDVVGRVYLGSPSVVLNVFRQHLPHETVVEGMIDIYPAGYLLSGYLRGVPVGGGPGKELEKLGQGFEATSVPRFGRYLLGDRVAFLGESNGDNLLWRAPNQYYGERQVFLLGCKFDVNQPAENPSIPTVLNPAIQSALNEWSRVGWWVRRPVYRDRLGITELPAGIDARHYVDKHGVRLLAIDNWSQLSGRSFKFFGSTIAVPTSRLSIVEVQ